MQEAIARDVPATLWNFVSEVCHLRPSALQPWPGDTLPEPARRLLVHDRDMTTTLADFYGSPLRVDLLQRRTQDALYLREVYLRTTSADRIVEYGVIAIALEQFTPEQQETIAAGRIPLGAVLHRFQIAFESAPIGFFSVPAARLAEPVRLALGGDPCFGRFNQLAKASGEPLAWIMEILPNAAV